MTNNFSNFFRAAHLFLGLLLLAPNLHAQFIFPQATSMSPLSVPANNPAFTLISQGVGFQSNGNAYAQDVPIEAGFHVSPLANPPLFPVGQNGDIIGTLIVNGDAGTLTVNIPENFFAQASGTYVFIPDWCADSCFSPVTFQFTVTPSSRCASGLQPIAGASLVDPVPDLLSGDLGITTDFTLLQDGDKGRRVRGVAADGVAQVVIRIPACTRGETINAVIIDEFSQPSNSVETDGGLSVPGATSITSYTPSISTTAVGTDDEPYGIITYLAPIDFVRSGTAADTEATERTIFVRISLSSFPGQDILRKITIVRPPIVLVHGLWSSRDAWGAFSPITEFSNSSLFENRVFAVDYSHTAGESVETNRPIVGGQITNFIQEYKDKTGVASVQADIVAHSMGGLITRSLALDKPPFSREYTGPYLKGIVHKLITIDTPFKGSPLAAELSFSSQKCRDAFARRGKIIGGAIGDLVPLSPILTRLSADTTSFPMPLHSIVGTADDRQTLLTETEISLTYLRWSWGGRCTRLLPDGTFLGTFFEPNDLIVAQSSQTLGPSSMFNGFIHAADPTLFAFGPDVLGYDTNQPNTLFPDLIPVATPIPRRVAELLNQSVFTGQFIPVN